MYCIILCALLTIALRLPQAMVDAKSPATSRSSREEKEWGTLIGSFSINSGRLYLSCRLSSRSRSSSRERLEYLSIAHRDFAVGHRCQTFIVRDYYDGLSQLVTQLEE